MTLSSKRVQPQFTARLATGQSGGAGVEQIRSTWLLAALLLACSGGGWGGAAQAQEAATSADDFDLGAERIDAEQVLVTNAGPQARKADCVPSRNPDEIVVCARDPMQYRIDSSLENATRKGEAARDGMPRAPEFAPSCRNKGGACMRVGKEPYRPILIDLAAIPEPLPARVAEKVRFALTPEELAAARRQAGLDDAETPPDPAPAAIPDP